MARTELTRDAVEATHNRMAASLEILRRRLGRPMTLSEKVLLGHLDDAESQELEPGRSQLRLRPDRVAFQDVLGQTGMLQFMMTGRDRVAVPTSIHCDHLIQARQTAASDLAESVAENGEVYDFLRSAAARYGAGFWEPGAGIIHQVILENYAFPGALIIGTDSHTPNGGGLGACAVGVGGADAVETIAGMPWELLYPRRIAVVLTGKLGGWTAPKDVILWVAGQLGVSGGTNAIVEYIGPGAATISATGKATITNMGAEIGATTSMFPWDHRMARYLEATGRGDLVPSIEAAREMLSPDPEALANPEAVYDRVLHLDLSALEPHLVGPHSPDRARPISALAAEVADPENGFVDIVSSGLIGSCTNSSYEDMSRAADVARQAATRGLTTAAEFLVTPGSDRVCATIERDGQMADLQAIGGSVLANACGPCIGQWRRARDGGDGPNSILTSFNRNFPARNDGERATMNFIASPEIVTALAIAGRLSFNPLTDELTAADGSTFRLEPPAPAPEVPERGFAGAGDRFSAPPEDGRGVTVAIRSNSKRLQALEPWSEWDGRDILSAPVLVKARGKTTTDQISPAGPWLSLRGHLDRFSDNMLSGAVNAFDGQVGHGLNLLDGSRNASFSDIARAYRSAGVPWVVIGDANYGEGSSREHAALSPRLLGGAAVIARSFARIHETNLKKQGLLALTFSSSDDYERIREDDRLDITGLAELAAGRPISCRISHSDGTEETILLDHSYSAEQLAWFRAGSALNVLRLNSKAA
jgi:aconitate hydratase